MFCVVVVVCFVVVVVFYLTYTYVGARVRGKCQPIFLCVYFYLNSVAIDCHASCSYLIRSS